MPFRSEKQRKFMWAKHPEIAERWTKEYGSTPRGLKDTVPARKRSMKRGK